MPRSSGRHAAGAPLPPPAPPILRAGAGIHAAFLASLEFFLAPLVPLLRDPEVSEIMVNGPDRIYIEKEGRIQLTRARFAGETDLQAAASNIAQFVAQPLSPERPLLDGRLPDGSRVCIVLGPVAAGGTHINIRRFARNTANPEFLLSKNAITPMAMEFLLLAVRAHRNIVVAGGAGSGKTTAVNVLTNAFHEDERIIVIEDTRELQVQRPHVVQMEARPPDAYGRGQVSVRDLFVAALRMRPDRIVVGEVRRGEALDMIQAMTSGHHGSLTTVHASSPYDTCYRIETMALMAELGGGAGIPLMALRRQVASALDLIVQTARLPSGRRLVTAISEVDFDESTQNYRITDLFVARIPAEAASEAAEAGRAEAAEGPAAATENNGGRMLEWTRTRPAAMEQFLMEGLVDQMQLTRPMLDAGTG
jgi:pilus assembly protein CpaF